MGRSTRKYAVLAKIESVYGTDSVPTGGANAILVSNVNVNPLNASNVDRNLLRTYYGASEQLIGVAFKEISFDVELVGSGTAGTAPGWGPLLRACAMAETIIAVTRVDYLPISAAFESLSMYCYADGVQHVLLGARGEWGLTMKVGEKPMLNFRFQGIDGSESAVANPALTLSAFLTPQVVTDAFTPNAKTGGTVSPTGAPAISAGTDFATTGIVLQSGNALNFKSIINLQEMEINDRVVTGTVEMDLTAAAEVTALAAVRANTVAAMSFEHGTVTGRKVLLHLPTVQRINPRYADLNQSLLTSFDVRCVPGATGNDEVRLVTSY